MSLTKIDRLLSGDETRLRAIRLRALADAPDAFETTHAEASSFPLDEWQRQLAQLVTFVATSEGCDVGIVRGAPHDDCHDTAYLLSLWVVPEMRRQGIAAALIDSAIAWAQAEGYRRLVLDVSESNGAAMALYLNKGFALNGTLFTLPAPRQHIRECQLEKTLVPGIRRQD